MSSKNLEREQLDGLIKNFANAMIELAIARSDLVPRDMDESIDNWSMGQVAADAINAAYGIDTCDDAPMDELVELRNAIVAAVAAEARLELQAEGTLSQRVRAMMRKRDWSLHWTHRSAYLHLEAAELAEAVRGKHGDTLEESADVLITLLALSPHELSEIIPVAERKVMELAAKSG